MARATLFVLIMVATGLLVYLLAAPHFLAPGTSPTVPTATPTSIAGTPGDSANAGSSLAPDASNPSGNSVSNSPRIEVPRSNAQREHDDLEAKRGPFYDWIRKNMKDVLVGWEPSASDPATLDLYLGRDDPSRIPWLMQNLVTVYAHQYGFDHVRFFLPTNTSDHWRLDSESSFDDTGTWNTFRK